MSVREDERQKNCPSRGLGIAAAAIGVGVGAALYYFFSKRAENPGEAGSTNDWSYEQQNGLKRKAESDGEAFRQRKLSVEQCSICFDLMNPSQEVMALPCTHRFHQDCIMPWLQQQQTCPMCRKSA